MEGVRKRSIDILYDASVKLPKDISHLVVMKFKIKEAVWEFQLAICRMRAGIISRTPFTEKSALLVKRVKVCERVNTAKMIS
jgi:hypothetical protein